MSQHGEVDDKRGKMAISYASGLSADHTQSLPSFRELLPPHLHDEIESSSYLSSRQPSSHERPVSLNHEFGSGSRPLSSRTPYGSPSKFPVGDVRDYPMTDRMPGERAPVQSRLPGNGVQPAAARGPSPILPSIRDLQTIPDRSLNAPAAGLPDHRGPSRTDAFAVQEFRGGAVGAPNYPPAGLPGSMSDRRDPYAGSSLPAAMHAQPQYPSYPGVIYQSDSEQASSQSLPPSQQSNFGILGDSVDSKNKRRRGNLPKPVTDILRAWFHEHLDHPYPSEEDKQMFMTRTGLTISQISNWFINARRRQLPALRNQMRNGASDLDSQRQSPFSDMEQTSCESPNRLSSGNKH
ncbi:isoform D of homeobox protein homothorax [Aspergillus udagawae]|nr:isoform D of homeobox protein homothorax [Aspergillus udagawae]